MFGLIESKGGAGSLGVGLVLGLVVGFGFGLAWHGDGAAVHSGWTDTRPVRGPEDAAVTIIEFSDYQCPACRQFHEQTFRPLIAEYGDRIRYAIRHFPLENIHPQARGAAQAAVCAHQQSAFWEYHEALFRLERTPSLSREALLERARDTSLDMDAFESCLDSRSSADMVAGDFLYGVSLGVRSTPSFLVNDRLLAGAQPLDTLRRAIDAALAGASEH